MTWWPPTKNSLPSPTGTTGFPAVLIYVFGEDADTFVHLGAGLYRQLRPRRRMSRAQASGLDWSLPAEASGSGT
jgi:hypothetical protein